MCGDRLQIFRFILCAAIGVDVLQFGIKKGVQAFGIAAHHCRAAKVIGRKQVAFVIGRSDLGHVKPMIEG
jgi:hypothetical protein